MTSFVRGIRSPGDPPVRAVLLSVRDALAVTYLVRLGGTSAQRPGSGTWREGTLGGVAQLSSGAWAIAAYTDPAHLLHGGGPVAFLEDVGDLSAAVASLITHWRPTGHRSTTDHRRKAHS
ncbi:hypothetical protein AB0M95_40290 [Sphaerisporangium sp. NPDC051017]|uniref:hypothetical protein n=1 Tax=Sphaerisporangium sp. NPDC051017 TaxID=3154636 RepID=UPI00343D9AFC